MMGELVLFGSGGVVLCVSSKNWASEMHSEFGEMASGSLVELRGVAPPSCWTVSGSLVMLSASVKSGSEFVGIFGSLELWLLQMEFKIVVFADF